MSLGTSNRSARNRAGLYGLIAFLSMTALSREAHCQDPAPEPGSQEYWRIIRDKAEVAFYSDSPLEELRRIREDVHPVAADYGDLWNVLKLLDEAEELLTNMTVSQRERYEQEKAFRLIAEKDTTIVSHLDYTGDGVDETQTTTIRKVGKLVYVDYLVLSAQDTLLFVIEEGGFPPIWSPFDEPFSAWVYALENAPPQGYRPQNIRREVSYQILASSLAAETGRPMTAMLPEARRYADEFKGYLLTMFSGFPGNEGLIWYEPLRKFVLFYSP